MRVPSLVAVSLVVLLATVGLATGQVPGSGFTTSLRIYGGSDYEFAERLAVDAAGHVYLLGRTFSADWHPALAPGTAAPGEPAAAAFVLKLSPGGDLIYAAPISSGFAFRPLDIAVGLDGSVHVLGKSGDVTHIVKIDASGSRREYEVTYSALGPNGLLPKAIAVEDGGIAVIAGWSPDGVFVARVDGRGSVFDMRVLPADADARDIAVDRLGDVYVVGTIASGALGRFAGAVQPAFAGGSCGDVFPPPSGPTPLSPCPDAFLLKLTRAGRLAYATYFGGTGWDEGQSVAVDANGSALVAGMTRSTDLPTARAMQPACKPGFAPLACGDAFVARFDAAGGALVYATYVGGVDAETVTDLAVDADGVGYLSGTIAGDGLAMARSPQPVNGGGTDGFVVALGPAGELRWSTYVGGKGDERVVGVGAAGGRVTIAGETMSPAWATGETFRGRRDLFTAGVAAP